MPFLVRITPARRIAIWFLATILVGAFILALPISAEGEAVPFIDALFTATSAVCVTGLVVVNIATKFSTFGEIVIMILIQVGGLGLMVISTLFFTAMGSRVSPGYRMTLKETFGADGGIEVRTILKSTFLLTFIVEAIGAVILFFPFCERFGAGKGAYFAVFHSISAFCNAGLSLLIGGVSEFSGSVTTLLSMGMLIIIGGIGFSVANEIRQRVFTRHKRVPLSLHTKMVINTTAALIIGGTLAFFLLEKGNAYGSFSTPMQMLQGFFQSVTSRTAGFDSVSQRSLTEVSLLLTIFLMIIGASPGSTGGGIKTTSFAIIVAAIVSRIRGNHNVNIYKRTVSLESTIKAVSIFVLAAAVIFTATSMLLLVESHSVPHSSGQEIAMEYFFETVSAFGTVGLSLGITPSLHTPGKLILILVMFAGRVGLLTMAYLVTRPEGRAPITYSEENVMIG